MSELLQMPAGMVLEKVILSKTVSNGIYQVDVALVLHKKQYEAALFLNRQYKPGPALPRPLEKPSAAATHWMSVRPHIGFTEEEATLISDEVLSENRVKKITFKDNWGPEQDDF